MPKPLKKKKLIKKRKEVDKPITDKELNEIFGDDELLEDKVKNHIYSILDQKKLLTYNAGWRTFILGFETELSDPVLGRLFGQTVFDDGTIKLDPNQKNTDAVETILHEILHVITESCGLGEPDHKTKKLSITNEELVTLMTRGIIQAVRLNKDLFKEIFNGIRE